MLRKALVLLSIVFASCTSDLEVNIKDGGLKGKYMQTKSGRAIIGFLGIPYAKPPVGDLRFKDPVSPDPWEGHLDVSEMHAVCPQINFFIRSEDIEGNEDCLYLNVYKPKIDSKELLPVMVFIHGGGYQCGGGNTQSYGPDLLLEKDIILVVLNYRLGALGFLSTGDDTLPGNIGMKDQSMALKWVRDNIKTFGGNPESVTVFGESAGGASTHLHMFSPLSKGLIHGGISQSGSAMSSWAIADKVSLVKRTYRLIELLKCSNYNKETMLKCLRKKDAYEFAQVEKYLKTWDIQPYILFAPVIEHEHPGAFITKHPADIVKSGQIPNPVPWVNGMTSEEGALITSSLLVKPQLLKEFDEHFYKLLDDSFMMNNMYPNYNELVGEVRKFYFGGDKITEKSLSALTDMHTDGIIVNGADLSNYLHVKYMKQPVYYYLFSYRGNYSMTSVFGKSNRDYGVCHADELQYLFEHEGGFSKLIRGTDDYKMSELLTTLWFNFAKYKNPTPDSWSVQPKWDPISNVDQQEFYHIKSPKVLVMDQGMFNDRIQFWRKISRDERSNNMKEEL